jgi:hypothetical protein
MRHPGRPLWAVALVCVGCYVSATVTGGDPRFLASSPAPQPRDAGDVDGEGGGCVPLASMDAPATFTTLYNDYFGPSPTAKASCSYVKNGCHATTGEPGGNATNYACSPTSKDDCYASLTSANAKNESGIPLVVAGDPNASYLPRVLRQANEPFNPTLLRMPLQPDTVAMCPSDIERVKAWIANGAKND